MTITKPSKTYSFTPGTGIRSSQTNTNFDNVFDVFEEDAYLAKGWFAVDNASFEYNSANSIKTTSDIDVTGLIQVGDKITFEQATDGEKFFFITAIDYNSTVANRTYIELYGGTDYDVDNEAITADTVGFSRLKAPFGFPLNPDKWTITTSTTSLITAPTTTLGTTAEISSSLRITIPAGTWNISSNFSVQLEDTAKDAVGVRIFFTDDDTNPISDTAHNWVLMRYEYTSGSTVLSSFPTGIYSSYSNTSSQTLKVYYTIFDGNPDHIRIRAGSGYPALVSATIAYL